MPNVRQAVAISSWLGEQRCLGPYRLPPHSVGAFSGTGSWTRGRSILGVWGIGRTEAPTGSTHKVAPGPVLIGSHFCNLLLHVSRPPALLRCFNCFLREMTIVSRSICERGTISPAQ